MTTISFEKALKKIPADSAVIIYRNEDGVFRMQWRDDRKFALFTSHEGAYVPNVDDIGTYLANALSYEGITFEDEPDHSQSHRFDYTVYRCDEAGEFLEKIEVHQDTQDATIVSDPYYLLSSRGKNHRFIMEVFKSRPQRIVQWNLTWLADRVFIDRVIHEANPDRTVTKTQTQFVAPIFTDGEIGREYVTDVLGVGITIANYPLSPEPSDNHFLDHIAWSHWKRGLCKWIEVKLVGFDWESLIYLAKDVSSQEWYRISDGWLRHYFACIGKGMSIADFIKYTEEGVPEEMQKRYE